DVANRLGRIPVLEALEEVAPSFRAHLPIVQAWALGSRRRWLACLWISQRVVAERLLDKFGRVPLLQRDALARQTCLFRAGATADHLAGGVDEHLFQRAIAGRAMKFVIDCHEFIGHNDTEPPDR